MNRTIILLTVLFLFVVQGTANAAPRVPTQTLTVDRYDDASGLPCSGSANDCTLRSAIEIVNSAPIPNHRIQFTGVDHLIPLTSPLPPITQDGVVIDAANRNIQIDAQGLHAAIFVISGDDALIEDFRLFGTRTSNQQTSNIILITAGADNIRIRNNIIGDYLDTQPCGGWLGGRTGISIGGNVSNIYIYGNSIRCLTGSGIYVGPSVTNVRIGEDENGDAFTAQRNTITEALHGVTIDADAVKLINNTIEDSSSDGVEISGDNNIVERNTLRDNGAHGLDVNGGTGTAIFRNTIARNTTDGIHLRAGADGNTIGCGLLTTTYDATRTNHIYDNGQDGIHLTGNGTTLNVVKCNKIGFAAGAVDLGNGGVGMRIDEGADANIIGGTTGTYNLIGNNGGAGILIKNATHNSIGDNRIGVNEAGTAAKGNGEDGIALDNGDNNAIGGSDEANRNIISGNTRDGIELRFGSDGNAITGNFIGTNLAGNAAIGNRENGIEVRDSNNNVVGRDEFDDPINVVGGNLFNGIELENADNTLLETNFIGVGIDQTSAVGNGKNGILLIGGSAENIIQGSSLIAHNAHSGVTLVNAGLSNQIRGVFGSVSDPWIEIFENGQNGIYIQNSDDTQLSSPPSAMFGCTFSELNVVNNTLKGIVNVDADNTQMSCAQVNENGQDGIEISGTSRTISFTVSAIENNGGSGVAVTGNAVQNRLTVNRFDGNAGIPIDLGDDGFDSNDAGDGDSGPNTRINHPLVTDGSNLNDVQGTACPFCEILIYEVVGGSHPQHIGEIAVLRGRAFGGADAAGNWDACVSCEGIVTIEQAAFVAVDLNGNTSEMSLSAGVPTAIGLQSMEVAEGVARGWLLLLTTMLVGVSGLLIEGSAIALRETT